MVQVLQAPERQPGFLESLLGSAINKMDEYSQGQARQQALEREYALKGALESQKQDSKFANQMDLERIKQEGKQNIQAEALRGKQEEKIIPLQGAMDTLNRMKALRKKGNLGIGSTYSPFSGTRKEAGEYEQLGKSLIQYATNIPIRNRLEFETLAEKLYDPTTTDATAEGILNAMERIITNSLQSAGGETSQNKPSIGSIGSKERPPISSFRIGTK